MESVNTVNRPEYTATKLPRSTTLPVFMKSTDYESESKPSRSITPPVDLIQKEHFTPPRHTFLKHNLSESALSQTENPPAEHAGRNNSGGGQIISRIGDFFQK